MTGKWIAAAALLALLSASGSQRAIAQAQAPAAAPAAAQDAAAMFGAREDVQQISLSPGGTKIAFVAPGPGPATILYVSDAADGSAPKVALSADGNPNRIRACYWVSDKRLVCYLHMVFRQAGQLLEASRIVAVDADGGNLKLLSNRTRADDAYVSLRGGQVIDWLPDESGAVLMNRDYVPQEASGTHMTDTRQGFGVDRIDTTSLAFKTFEQPRRDAVEFISDGRGKVRIMGTRQQSADGYDRGDIAYFYRTKDSGSWKPLGTLANGQYFDPFAVDPDLDLAYGFAKKDGRQALYSVALDGSKRETLILERPDVDVGGLIYMGRRHRVIGATYVTDKRHAVYFDAELKALAAQLSKALPGSPLMNFMGASDDEKRLLIWAGSDSDPGTYYLLDRATKKLQLLMLARPELEGVKLASVRPVTYRSADGTMIPAYLTLPPGKAEKGLPAIVMPHGGPSSRDEWGFDWLAQFYANRGYAVLQPNFRGSAGYGSQWFQTNGFKSWRVAIGDVNDAGRWLVSEGIADPAKLAVVGWSYGGYAALQSAVVDPGLYKAIVAVAPVTDLGEARNEWAGFTNADNVRDFFGNGPHIEQGSPARHAEAFKAPVLLFHGTLDRNVAIRESRLMADKLKDAGKSVALVEFDKLDHQLDDSEARAQMLRRSDEFLRKALGL
jgi:acetyl esterase/lipase